MSKLDLTTFGRPVSERHHKLRSALSVVAAMAGGLGVIGLIFVMLGNVSPADAALLWVAVTMLLAVWITGIWWRWDSPDARDRRHERERRGF
jgi:hypothetical protein